VRNLDLLLQLLQVVALSMNRFIAFDRHRRDSPWLLHRLLCSLGVFVGDDCTFSLCFRCPQWFVWTKNSDMLNKKGKRGIETSCL
jgi:hypothetical protein